MHFFWCAAKTDPLRTPQTPSISCADLCATRCLPAIWQAKQGERRLWRAAIPLRPATSQSLRNDVRRRRGGEQINSDPMSSGPRLQPHLLNVIFS